MGATRGHSVTPAVRRGGSGGWSDNVPARASACPCSRSARAASGLFFVVVFDLLTGNLGLLTGKGVGWLVGGPLGKVSGIGVGRGFLRYRLKQPVRLGHYPNAGRSSVFLITVLWSAPHGVAREPPGPGGPLRYRLPDYMYPTN